jgi:uncharacterized membrane protein
MNGAHIHLTINDVPILSMFTAVVSFTIALLAKSRPVWARAGLIAVAIAVVGAATAFLSGILAQDVIDGMPRTSNKALSSHHVWAIVATSLVAIAAVISAVVFLRARKRGGVFDGSSIAVMLAAAIMAAAALAWTGLAGGRVNHPELQEPGDLDDGAVHPH